MGGIQHALTNNILAPAIMAAAQYVILAGLVFLLLVYLVAAKILRNRIRPGLPGRRQIVREVLNSLRSALIFSVAPYAIYAALGALFPGMHAFRVAWRAAQPAWSFPFALAFLLVLQDTYFYWTHRLMHTQPWFRIMHAEHHKSHSPSPWAA